MPAAILLIAHGSRRAEANADLAHMAARLAERVSDPIVEIAYLELAEPTIPQGLARCVERGADAIRMAPYFLSAGAHVTEDLRAFQQAFMAAHPQISCRLCPPLGLHPGLIDALVDRLSEET
jgi:sirohydrochlorin ferrochelatase